MRTMDDDYEVGIAIWKNGNLVVTERHKMFDKEETDKVFDIMIEILSTVVRKTGSRFKDG